MTTHALPAPSPIAADGAPLSEQLRALPDEAFTRLQYLAPEIGCYNGCAMCSQSAAGQATWRLTRQGLTDVLLALQGEAERRGLQIASGRIHRPRVLFPYLDNDIASYPYLDTYAQLARDVLGVRLRVSTIGYSASSPRLTAMHQRIATELADVFDGIRFSLTPYAAGWQAHLPGTSRDTYTRDLAHALATYRPVLDLLGHGPATAAVELRFSPLLGVDDLLDTHVDGHHVLACGPHLLIALTPTEEPLPGTVIERLDERTQPVYSLPGAPYLHVRGVSALLLKERVRAVLAGELTEPHLRREVRLHRFVNADGPYFAADPDFHPDGRFTALHLYPATDRRKVSGYTDATRWFLNAVLAHKADRGLGRRDAFPDATATDVDAVLGRLQQQADALAVLDPAAAQHLARVVIPLVATHARALELAGYPPAVFFSRDFTVDTGQIVNQGRAQGLFRGLAATNGEPMTPREERGFGQASLSTVRGPIWRITPLPMSSVQLPARLTGRKNPVTARASLLVEEMDPCHLAPVMRSNGCVLRRYTLTGVEIEQTLRDQALADLGMPGFARSTEQD